MEKQWKDFGAVIFDMDGVIFDTERLAAKGWKEAARVLRVDITNEQIDQNRGSDIEASRALFYRWFGSEFPYDKARKIRTSYLESYIKEQGVPVKAGFPQFYTFLKERGIKTALATSTQREKAEGYFRSTGLSFGFDVSICGTEIRRSKPAPDIYLQAAEELGLRASQCMVVEDSLNGIKAGLAAGCSVVMIPDMAPPDEMAEARCMGICKDFHELMSLLL